MKAISAGYQHWVLVRRVCVRHLAIKCGMSIQVHPVDESSNREWKSFVEEIIPSSTIDDNHAQVSWSIYSELLEFSVICQRPHFCERTLWTDGFSSGKLRMDGLMHKSDDVISDSIHSSEIQRYILLGFGRCISSGTGQLIVREKPTGVCICLNELKIPSPPHI